MFAKVAVFGRASAALRCNALTHFAKPSQWPTRAFLVLMCLVRWKHDVRDIGTHSGNDVWRNVVLHVSFYVTLAP
jgi:hypothetical protein